MAARLQRLAPAALLLAALAGCIQDDGTRFNPLRTFTPQIDDDAERELGLEFDRALQEAVTVIHDPVVAGFLNDLGQAVVSQIEPQPFVYRFRVVEDPRLNAFAVPGGYVYFHSGTIMAAASIDELAGVMGHEIAHVKAHHYAKMRQQSAIPDLATQIIGMSAAIAAKEPGLLMVAQGINVSMQLRYSREAEAEADHLGAIWMSRAGFEPTGIVRFFQRILEEHRRTPNEIPPYLYSHPAVEERIEAVEIEGQELRPLRRRDPVWNERLGEVQARLALLLQSGRESLPPSAPLARSAETEELLAEAERRAGRGERDAALLTLARAAAAEPNDPRVPFRIGELLLEANRPAEAVDAFRRTLSIDPSHALIFYRLGEAHKAAGDRHRAVFAFEQAEMRASESPGAAARSQSGSSSGLRQRAAFEIEKLTFPVLAETGFGDGRELEGEPPARLEAFPAAARRIEWWARLGPHFIAYADRFQVRWIDPSGAVVEDEPALLRSRSWIGSRLERESGLDSGRWTVEARLDGDVVHSDQVVVGNASQAAP